MSQRNSGYDRVERDAYQTPAWATAVLAEWLRSHVAPFPEHYLIWEPAAGKGQMVDELRRVGFPVNASDIEPDGDAAERCDFLALPNAAELAPVVPHAAIITNPPYKHADAFVRKALDLMRPYGLVAMLLKVDFDSGKTRRDLFADFDHYRAKIVLTDRIQWFAHSTSSPSENHAFFVWDWRWSQRHSGPCRTFWAGKPAKQGSEQAQGELYEH